MPPEMTFADFRLSKVDFSINPKFDEKTKQTTISPQLSLNHEFRPNEKELVVLIGIRQIKGNIPFYFDVQAGGLFKFNAIPDEKMLNQLGTINCPSILFPYVRETIADLTRRAGFPPLHLAPVNFIEFAKNIAEKKTAPKAKTATK